MNTNTNETIIKGRVFVVENVAYCEVPNKDLSVWEQAAQAGMNPMPQNHCMFTRPAEVFNKLGAVVAKEWVLG